MIASPPPATAPATAQPEDLAFELGRAHALRQLCFGREDAVWRERMSDLLKTERPDPAASGSCCASTRVSARRTRPSPPAVPRPRRR